MSRGEGDWVHPPLPDYLRDCWEFDLKEEVTESWRLEQLVDPGPEFEVLVGHCLPGSTG